jgi:twitching motility two-component system response regulator PilH
MARILVVDDSPTERRAFGDVLRGGGHEVVECAHSRALPDWTREPSPDLIFLDIVMPEENGFQACRRLRADAATRDVPIVFVTSRGDASDREWGLRQGAVAYLVKPVPEGEIHGIIAALLRPRRAGRR